MHPLIKKVALGLGVGLGFILMLPSVASASHRHSVGDWEEACDCHRWASIDRDLDYVFHHMTPAEARLEYQHMRAHSEKMREIDAALQARESRHHEHAQSCEHEAWVHHRLCLHARDRDEEEDAAWHAGIPVPSDATKAAPAN